MTSGSTGRRGGWAAPANDVPPPSVVPGVAVMQTMTAPVGFSAVRWRRVCLDAATVVEEHGGALCRFEWTAAMVFGLHPIAPSVRVDCCGLTLCVNGGTVTALTATTACI